jgi:hypothetical protein
MKMILLSLLICNQSFGQGIVQQLDSLMLKNFPADRPGQFCWFLKMEKSCIKKVLVGKY